MADDERLPSGAEVKIKGVTKEDWTCFNGRMGKICGYDEGKSRYIIIINDSEFGQPGVRALPGRFKGKEFKFLREQLLADGEEALTSIKEEPDGRKVHEFKVRDKVYWKEEDMMEWVGSLDIPDLSDIQTIYSEDSNGAKKTYSAEDPSWEIPVDKMEFPLTFKVIIKNPAGLSALPEPLPAFGAVKMSRPAMTIDEILSAGLAKQPVAAAPVHSQVPAPTAQTPADGFSKLPGEAQAKNGKSEKKKKDESSSRSRSRSRKKKRSRSRSKKKKSRSRSPRRRSRSRRKRSRSRSRKKRSRS